MTDSEQTPPGPLQIDSAWCRLGIAPVRLALRKPFGTSHSATTFRHNAVVTLSMKPPANNDDDDSESPAYLVGYGEIGLPPFKPGVYEGTLEGCFQFTRAVAERVIGMSTTAVQDQSDNDPQHSSGTETMHAGSAVALKTNLCHGRADLEKSFQRLLDMIPCAHKMASSTSSPRLDLEQQGVIAWRLAQILLAADDMLDSKAVVGSVGCLRAAHSGVETAVFDCWAKLAGLRLVDALQCPSPASSMQGFYTAAMADNLDDVCDSAAFGLSVTPNIKVKLSADVVRGQEVLRRLRELQLQRPLPTHQAASSVWTVDANAAWTPATCEAMLPALLEHKISIVEQPFPVDVCRQPVDVQKSWQKAKLLLNQHGIRVFADESMHVASDVAALVDLVDGVNVKMEKCGGYRAAVAALLDAQAAGMETWTGVMVGGSLNSTATAHLLRFAAFGDLDGALLVTEASDPFQGGVVYDDKGLVCLPDQLPGIGVSPRS